MLEKSKWLDKPTLLVLVVGAIVCLLVLFGRPREKPLPFVPPPPPELETIDVSPVTTSVTVVSQGTVTPRTETQLVSQVAGRVVDVSSQFVAGGYFKEGEVLVRIDPRDYEIALAQAKSTLANANQLLAEEKGLALQAKREWRDLGNEDANALFLRKPQLAAAEAAVEAASAGVEKAAIDLERTEIRLPYSGRVRSKSADLGQYLNIGSVLGTVFTHKILEVRLPLTANQVRVLGLAGAGQQALSLPVALEASFGDKPYQWKGDIVRMEASVDTDTRLFFVIAEITDTVAVNTESPAILPVGMFVQGHIASLEQQNVVELPRTALVENDRVFIAEDGVAKAVPVDVLEVNDQRIRIRGLVKGQKVIATPPGYLETGMSVKPEKSGSAE